MSTTALRIVNAASDYPITLTDAKSHLRVSSAADDAHIQRLIAAATSWAQDETRRILISTDVELRFDRFPSSCEYGYYDGESFVMRNLRERSYSIAARSPAIFLPGGKVTAVASVQYIDINGDPQTLTGPTSEPAGSGYQEDLSDDEAAWLYPAVDSFWPAVKDYTVNAVTIAYTAGFGSAPDNVPETIRHAIRLKLADMYYMRDSSDDDAGTAAERLIHPYVLQYL